MNPYRIYTRKTMGLDNRVWRLMFILIVLSLGLLSYRLINNDNKCIPFSFTVKTLSLHTNNVFYTGEIISFTASASSKDIDWDFGDNTGGSGAYVHHQFLKEGIYLVRASGNSLCETEQEIRIQKRLPDFQPADPIRGKIGGLTSFYTYTEQKFTYPGSAGSYEWTVQNHPIFGTKSGQTVSFTFPLPGTYTIQVQLDSDLRKRDYLDVVVLDEVKQKSSVPEKVPQLIQPYNPPPQQTNQEIPAQKHAEPDSVVARIPSNKKIIISETLFFSYLQKVQNKEMAAADFDKYLCGGGSTPVIVNGDKNTNFTALCEEISGKKKRLMGLFKKKITLEKVQLYRENDCVIRIEVKYK